jgi:hypothetical protein
VADWLSSAAPTSLDQVCPQFREQAVILDLLCSRKRAPDPLVLLEKRVILPNLLSRLSIAASGDYKRCQHEKRHGTKHEAPSSFGCEYNRPQPQVHGILFVAELRPAVGYGMTLCSRANSIDAASGA